MKLSLWQGFRDARQTVGSGWPLIVAIMGWMAIGLAALLERRLRNPGSDGSAPSLLEATTFGIVVPLASYALTTRSRGSRDELMDAHWARHGASRRLFALGRLSFSLALGSAIAVSSAIWALCLSRAVLTAPPPLDASVFSFVLCAVVGAVSYASCTSLAQLLGGGVGLVAYLLGDWVLGSGSGIAALPWPRGHLRSLLGGPAVLGMSAWQAAQFLVCLALASGLIYARRLPR